MIWTFRIRKKIQLQPWNNPVPLRHPCLHGQMVVWILMCYQYSVSDIRLIIYGLDMSITLYAILWWFVGVSLVHFIDFYTYSNCGVTWSLPRYRLVRSWGRLIVRHLQERRSEITQIGPFEVQRHSLYNSLQYICETRVTVPVYPPSYRCLM